MAYYVLRPRVQTLSLMDGGNDSALYCTPSECSKPPQYWRVFTSLPVAKALSTSSDVITEVTISDSFNIKAKGVAGAGSYFSSVSQSTKQFLYYKVPSNHIILGDDVDLGPEKPLGKEYAPMRPLAEPIPATKDRYAIPKTIFTILIFAGVWWHSGPVQTALLSGTAVVILQRKYLLEKIRAVCCKKTIGLEDNENAPASAVVASLHNMLDLAEEEGVDPVALSRSIQPNVLHQKPRAVGTDNLDELPMTTNGTHARRSSSLMG